MGHTRAGTRHIRAGGSPLIRHRPRRAHDSTQHSHQPPSHRQPLDSRRTPTSDRPYLLCPFRLARLAHRWQTIHEPNPALPRSAGYASHLDRDNDGIACE
ncbi:excalibur calcium-binding domain-containing protein [Nocardia sp. NBC_00565]|uniref:excalibur calcium-binding domain-containing protein n=1 Tax=Nocardia sp. NBC_00565 TaxID=2975993 RepID=UPI003FA5C051